jgi:hypothetical protein
VHAAVDACVCYLLHEVVDLCPSPRHAFSRVTGRHQDRHGASPDLCFQHCADGTGDNAVCTGILGMEGGVDKWCS